MFAVFESGGKQHIAKVGERVKVEKLDQENGTLINFDKIVLLKDSTTKIGAPYVEGASIEAKVIDIFKDKKIKIIKLRRRKHQMRRKGHRQKYTILEITKINS